MVKLVYCITRKPGMSREAFLDYWRGVHAPIGRRIPGLRRLVQSWTVPIPGDAAEPAFDGMAELWFDSPEALLAARRSAEWRASSEDEANFVDRAKVAYFVTEEAEVP